MTLAHLRPRRFARLPEGACVGSVDKFQGQEAELVIVSMTTSSQDDLPSNKEFLYGRNLLHVAVSRAKCLAVVLTNPELMASSAKRRSRWHWSIPCAG